MGFQKIETAILEKWRKTGLIDNVGINVEIAFANKLEELSNYIILVGDKVKTLGSFINSEVILIPLLIRTMKRLNDAEKIDNIKISEFFENIDKMDLELILCYGISKELELIYK